MIRRIKPNVKELSLAFNPATGKKFFMFKEENNIMSKLMEILEKEGPLVKEDQVNKLLKDLNITGDTAETLKGALKLLNSIRGEIPQGVLSNLAKSVDEYNHFAFKFDNEYIGNLRKRIDEELEAKTKELEIKMSKDTNPEIKSLQEELTSLRKDLDDSKKIAADEKLARRKIEVLSLLKDIGAVGDIEETASLIVETEVENKPLADKILEQQKKSAELLKSSGLDIEIGSTSPGSVGRAYEKLNKLVKEKLEKDKSITPGKAWKAVIRENPELYKEYSSERPSKYR